MRNTTFQDAKSTTKDPCLLAPPGVEFAPYQRVPGNRLRKDGRQGTIDQDPEFIDFLQSLTEPVSKIANGDTDEAETKQLKVTVTPLVQFIKDKKANKVKDSPAKAPKAQSKEAKIEKPDQKKVSVIKKEPLSAAEKARREKATQDAVKAINRSVASMAGQARSSKTDPQPTPSAKETAPTPPSSAKKERERGSASTAAKILQRDLGLSLKEHRTPRTPKATVDSLEASKATPAASPKVILPPSSSVENPRRPSSDPTQAPSHPAAIPAGPPTGPRIAKSTPATQPPQSAAGPVQRLPRTPPQPSPGAKSAFLKHANPSQGITEPLLLSTFSAFGNVTKCEIDKKKGFGYIDFDDTEGLRKAMQASPLKVGNGQVVVLENRTRVPIIRSGPAHGRAAIQHPQPLIQQKQPQQASAPPQQPETQAKTHEAQAPIQAPIEAAAPGPLVPGDATNHDTSPPSTPAVPPTAPRGAPAMIRGGRGGHMSRGNFGPPGRGGRGGGFRGGRGPFRGHPPRGGGPGVGNATASANQPSSQLANAASAPATGGGGEAT